jgi:hypothetical protein
MTRTAQPGKVRQAGSLTCRACLLGISFSAALFLTGCSGLLHGSKNHKTDPLLGDPAKDGDKGGSGGPSRTGSNVPPIPSASSSSNAALAMATPLPGARPLSIGEPLNEQARPATALTSANNVPGGATLSRPPPVVVPVPRETADAQPALMTVAANQSNEYFLSQLRARGVSWHRADSVPGGIRFSCIVPNRQNPTVTRTFEATAPDFPAAVNAVLQQIDQNR